MKYFCNLLLLIVLPFSLQAQLRFKPQFEAAAGFEKDNFYLLNVGLGIEKKIDINKSIESGIYYHNFDFNFSNTSYGFYEAFIQNTPNEKYMDSTTDFRVAFNFVSIPVGYNHYISPRTYLSYKLGFNFFTSSTYQGIRTVNHDYSTSETIFKARFTDDIFKKFYLSHNISINRIFFRRLDVGLSFIFTKSSFFRKLDKEIYRNFNQEVSKYFAMGLTFKYFIFQINSKKI